ncbi:unnamed protein product [Acanthoscelides obtectus]|uniref:A-kinase anchor protein 7-like phosphoesterase domain-containing protein n=1 Tax=Acanthoscelides obtectus TaxID=200917 RepID=A0A9P0K9W9_ACAOB|nr:unnamed protein product [Acanthoscelides obtectus]CAK1660912.1 hypothetical protein AOBTE_LOCUS22330 [Acanthoscelides obtectus]
MTIKIMPLIEKHGPITIHVSGVECMTDDHKKANVIYANAKIVEESEEWNLQKIVNDLSDFFYEKDIKKASNCT